MSDRPRGTSWMQVENLLEILDRMITEAETEETRQFIQGFRKRITDELDALPWDWR